MSAIDKRKGQRIARTERLCDEIRHRRSQGESYATIATALCLGHTTVERLVRELGLATSQQPRPVAPTHNADDLWTQDDIRILRELWLSGLSTAKIGAKMGRTKSGVIGKARRIGLPGRPSPVGVGRTKSEPPMQLIVAVVARERRAPVPKPRLVQAPVAFAEPRISHVPARPTVAATGKAQCQFPLWGHNVRPVIREGQPWICGQPAILGRSWCPQCWGIVYQAKAQKKPQHALG